MGFDFEDLSTNELMEIINEYFERNKYYGTEYSWFSLNELIDTDVSKEKLVKVIFENRHRLDEEILYTDENSFYTLSEADARERMIELIKEYEEYCLSIYERNGGIIDE